MLTNVGLYWFTGTGGSSANLYYETLRDPAAKKRVPRNRGADRRRAFPEPGCHHSSLGGAENNIVHWTEFAQGGHFAALEVPELLVADMQTFFRSVWTNAARA